MNKMYLEHRFAVTLLLFFFKPSAATQTKVSKEGVKYYLSGQTDRHTDIILLLFKDELICSS